MLDKFKRVSEAHAVWLKHGAPTRSPERIAELYDNFCSQCEFFKMQRCTICGCRIKRSGIILNKLAMATSRCPLEQIGQEPKWIEDIKLDEQAPAETPVETQTEEPPKPAPKIVRGCGCGS